MRAAAAAVVLLAAIAAAAGQERQPGVDDLLARAAVYVQKFVTDFTNVVAEEEFRQDRLNGQRRRLTSDFLLVQYPGSQMEWLSFRDVSEVDGRPVRDQQDRLTKLFLLPFDDARRRAEEITIAASRHSLAQLGGLSNPLLALAFLQSHYQPQFDFEIGAPEPDLGPRVRALSFEERFFPTAASPVRRTPPITGKVWLDEVTGRVFKTETRAGVAPNTATSTVTFRFDADLGIDVPARMRDSRVGFEGVATYRRFRRFQIRTAEEIETPQPR